MLVANQRYDLVDFRAGGPTGNSRDRKVAVIRPREETEVRSTGTVIDHGSNIVPVLRTSPKQNVSDPRSYDRGYYLPAFQASSTKRNCTKRVRLRHSGTSSPRHFPMPRTATIDRKTA